MREIAKMYPKDFDSWDEDDVVSILAAVEERDYKPGTKNEYRKTLKRFVRFQYGDDSPLLRLIKQKRDDSKKPEIVSEDDVLRMIDAAKNPRDKALIAVAYEGGLRIGEVAGLRIGDVSWDREMRARIKVRGKTGERVIPLVMSAPYLWRWLEIHPFKDDPSAIVFCSLSNRNYGGMMGYYSLWKLFVGIGRKAGIKKRVNPHMLRHSRATVLANFLTEAQMCEYFGWRQGSDTPRVYVHLSGRDIDRAVMRVYGFEDDVEESLKAKPKKCPRCGKMNSPTDRYCSRCALLLDEGERARFEIESEKVVEKLVERASPELLENVREMILLVRKVREDPLLLEMIAEMLND